MTEDQIEALYRRAMATPHPAWPCAKSRLREIVQLEGAALEKALAEERGAAIERARARGGDKCAQKCDACTCSASELAAWISARREEILTPLPEPASPVVDPLVALTKRVDALEAEVVRLGGSI